MLLKLLPIIIGIIIAASIIVITQTTGESSVEQKFNPHGFSTNVLFCEVAGGGDWIEIKYSIESYLDDDYSLGITINFRDENGNVLDFKNWPVTVNAGQIKYDRAVAEYKVQNIDYCDITINRGYVR